MINIRTGVGICNYCGARVDLREHFNKTVYYEPNSGFFYEDIGHMLNTFCENRQIPGSVKPKFELEEVKHFTCGQVLEHERKIREEMSRRPGVRRRKIVDELGICKIVMIC